ncbi:hypothetical protein ACLIYP_30630, partial [Streptomyces nanhaiensis]
MTTATTVDAADVRPGAAVQPPESAAGPAPESAAGPAPESAAGPAAPVRVPAAGTRGTRLSAAMASHRTALPALATVLLVCVPAHRA